MKTPVEKKRPHMHTNQWGVSYKTPTGYQDRRYESLHGAKSRAGRLVRSGQALSACVYDCLGTPILNLKATPAGVQVTRGEPMTGHAKKAR